jgi:anti-anti-sigma factor
VDALTIDVTHQGPRAVVLLRGELDDDSAAHVRDIDVAALAAAGCTELVVDLGELAFLDSGGIGSLVGLRNRAAALHVTTTVESAPAHIKHTLTLAGLAALFGLSRQ